MERWAQNPHHDGAEGAHKVDTFWTLLQRDYRHDRLGG
jgi:hypothetical protein